jgi:prepilin-type N-terminal cleavage/methylation domain-containing protein
MKRIKIHNQKGFSFVEVLIALLIVAIVASAFLLALAGASKGLSVADIRTTAESLARTQIETIKEAVYINYAENAHAFYSLVSAPPNFGISTVIEPIDINGDPFSESGGVFSDDKGIQQVTVTIAFHGDDVLTLVDYKVDR